MKSPYWAPTCHAEDAVSFVALESPVPPDVVDCAVFGIPDARLGERLKATVELRSGSSATADGLEAWSADRLARFKCPEVIELVGTLPRDPNGKVLKRRLRDAHWGDGTVQVDSHVRVR